MLASIFATILFSVLQLGTVNAADTPDGTCGGTTGWTCTSPEWGSCCSKYGYCGSTTGLNGHCDNGCQPTFSGLSACSVITVSDDGSCGAAAKKTCAGGLFDGKCCSGHGWCGTTAAFCSNSAAPACQGTAYGAACTA